MLVSMTVRNIALIEHLQMDFHNGMHVLSGETGAGKSIIIDSINLMLGERADRGLIRSGCDKASVEALVDISKCPQVQQILAQQELEAEENLLSIFREITTEGRNICRVCGVIVPLTVLRSITAHLVDIHGQHEHQSLLDSKMHMAFLDSFGDEAFAEKKAATAQAYKTWRESSSRFAQLRKENAQREERQAYLETRVKELDAAHIEQGEAEQLAAEKARFASAEKIDASIRSAYEEVMGGGREKSAVNKLRDACSAVEMIEELDPRFKALASRLSSAYYEAEEMGIELREILENDSFDPERNEAIQERLDQIRRLERRYGMTADELVLHHEEIREELAHLGGMEERLKRAEAEYKQKLASYRACAAKLTEARTALARQFEAIMEAELKDLGMNSTRFACVFELPAPDQKKIPTPNGDDHVCFYIAPNPGEPLKPLDKTASGGELSRLMLALKTAGAAHDGIPCMIFDEIDTGISGKTAWKVAKKMGQLSEKRQIICITHLPQIAAMADTHFLIEKNSEDRKTKTELLQLDEEAGIRELARMLGGEELTDAVLENAREMRRQAKSSS